uniref:Uncharacterized protein n=1 Tax=Xenopus tropicalis TaxID=8364 RepID=A0A1B8Y8N0_XENTR
MSDDPWPYFTWNILKETYWINGKTLIFAGYGGPPAPQLIQRIQPAGNFDSELAHIPLMPDISACLPQTLADDYSCALNEHLTQTLTRAYCGVLNEPRTQLSECACPDMHGHPRGDARSEPESSRVRAMAVTAVLVSQSHVWLPPTVEFSSLLTRLYFRVTCDSRIFI